MNNLGLLPAKRFFHGTISSLLLAGMLLFSACENDLNKIKAIVAADNTLPTETTRGVDVIYSDSALVKFRLTTPLLIKTQGKSPVSVMPKGIKIIFLDQYVKEIGNIVSDSAITRDDNKFIEFRRNVVATNPEGSVYRSDELIYDVAGKKIYSNKPIEMTKKDGDVMHGSSFTSDDRMLHPIFQNATAIIHVNGENFGQ